MAGRTVAVSQPRPCPAGSPATHPSVLSISFPNAAIPSVRPVRWYSAEPHNLNENKSLYPPPSGARGSDLTDAGRRARSVSSLNKFRQLLPDSVREVRIDLRSETSLCQP